ncbi:MFS transporter [Brevibacillus thermoruber]|uniref:MFS transporter n=1 Tax=Brevibacillus thermoruber TaxID=33942 RepID=UPI000688AF55|nr:MFS transporter [Brevibacillus thermoruber]
MNPSSFADRNFRMLWTGQFFSICSLTVMVPLLPFYLAELGAVTPEANGLWTGLSLAAPAVTLSLSSPVWGKYGDRFGRKWMVVRALIGIAASLGLMGLAQTPLQFFLARLLQGACGGVVDAAAAFTGSQAREGTEGRVMGSLQSATAAGSLLGPLVGGTLTDVFGFRPILWATALLLGFCGLGAAMVLKEPPREMHVPHRENVSLPHAWRNVLRHRRMRNVLVAGMLAQFGAFGLVTVFAPRVQEMVGSAYAASWVGVLQAVTWGATLFGSLWWGRRNDRIQVEKNVCAALAGCGVSVMLQAIPASVGWLIPLRVLQGFCFAALVPSIFLVVAKASHEKQRGVNIGISNSVLVMGQIAGSLWGAAFAAYLPMEWTFAIMGFSFLAGAVWLVASTRHAVSTPSFTTIMMRWRTNDDKQIDL